MKTSRYSLLILSFIVLCIVFLGGVQPACAQTFQHPGVLVSKAQLDYIKTMVAAHTEPFYSAFLKAQKSNLGSLTYTPYGPPSDGFIKCGATSNPDIGCFNSDEDASAAYLQSLLWYITGNQQYATNAITILNLYGHNLKGYSTQSPYSNAPPQAAWDGEKWPRAAEIVRYTNAGWADGDITAFKNMLTSAILPRIIKGSTSNGNWEISMIEALIGIGVFNDDTATYNTGINFWRQRIPAYFYYHTDGSKPVPAPRGTANWYGQTVYDATVDGISQETCRDFGHAQYGLAGALNAAETAHIQGIDLYTDSASNAQNRLTAALEFNAYYQLGNPVPTSVCGGTVALQTYPLDEIGYNEYHNRLHVDLPNTFNYLQTVVRQLSDPVDHHMMVYESLSHGGDASALQPFSMWTAANTSIVRAGSNASYTVTVVPGSDPSPSVLFNVTGLPSGVTSTFSPTTVTGAGTSTLTLATSDITPSGNYTITLTGTGTASTFSNTLNLTVNSQSADYSIAASPAVVSAVAGDNASFTTTFTPIGGYVSGVTLNVTDGLPPGATATFSPTAISAAAPTSTLTVLTAGTTASGTYPFTISATDGLVTHTTTATLTTVPLSGGCIQQLGNNWISGTIPTQTGAFTAEWDATASTALNNTNVGLSLGPQTAFTGLALAARFNPTGTIDARNAGAFAADNVILYIAGTSYHFRAVVNVAANTYSLYVTPTGQSEIVVGSNYAFRSEQAGITSIDHWDAISQVGTLSLCNLVVNVPDFSISASPSSQTVVAGGSTTFTATATPIASYAGEVTWSTSGLPSDATAIFNPITGSSTSYSSTLNVSTSTSLAPGSYPFTISATDGTLTHATALELIVNALCQIPIASAQSLSISANSSTNVVLSGTLGSGCSSSDTLTFAVVGKPSHGVLTGTAPALAYIPDASYTGTDSFSFTVTDANSLPTTSSAATIDITVSAPITVIPAITSLSPAHTTAGVANLTLTVQGSGFISGSTILWNGASRTTTFVSSSQLTAAITATDLKAAGIVSIIVSTPGTGDGTSSSMNFAIDTIGAIVLSPKNDNITVTRGQSIQDPLVLFNAPSGAQTSFTCYNLPTNATCSYSASTQMLTITTGTNTPAGTYQLLIVCNTNSSQTASLNHTLLTLWCGLLGLPLGWFGFRRRSRWIRYSLTGVLGIVFMFVVGCSSGSGAPTLPPASPAQSSTTITLIVN